MDLMKSSNNWENFDKECYYIGTDFLEVKIYLIGVFAALLAVTSLFFNAFFTWIFILNSSLRKSPLYYFGILAVLDTIMAVNYLALMAVPVYMDEFQWLWLYYIFLAYLRPMLTLSNITMFSSCLLILIATVERLLRTFQSEKLASVRKFLEQRRPEVCFGLICIAIVYKICTYFEIHFITHEHCNGWSRFEIMPTELAENSNYKFWWMFVTRNLVDRIFPFFALVLMNFLIIQTLKREHRKTFSPPNLNVVILSNRKKKSSFLKRTFSINNNNNNNNVEDQVNRKNLRDATRALLAIVTMYIMSQILQVLITFWEAFWKGLLENDYAQFYSYLNDIMSIMTLLSSALRFPVYYTISKPISTASREIILRFYSHKKSIVVTVNNKNKNSISLINNNNNNNNNNNSKNAKNYEHLRKNLPYNEQKCFTQYKNNAKKICGKAKLATPEETYVIRNNSLQDGFPENNENDLVEKHYNWDI